MRREERGTILSGVRADRGGDRYVVTSEYNRKRVWNIRSVQAITPSFGFAVDFADFNPEGSAVVTTSGLTARLWNARTGRPLAPVLRHEWAPAKKWDRELLAGFSPVDASCIHGRPGQWLKSGTSVRTSARPPT